MKINSQENNIAFIDGQNFYQSADFKVDFKKFRIYLKNKYKVELAYYFIGFKSDQNKLYENLQNAGFILIFSEKPETLLSNKKGNIDVQLVFYAMKKLLDESEDFGKIVLVSGDGDFKILVDYLIKKNRFLKILFPSKKNMSSLYKKITSKYYDFILRIKHFIEYK